MEMEASPSVRHNTVNWINDCKPHEVLLFPVMIISGALAVFVVVVFCSGFQKRAGSCPRAGAAPGSPAASSAALRRSAAWTPPAPAQSSRNLFPRPRSRGVCPEAGGEGGVPLRGGAESGRCAPGAAGETPSRSGRRGLSSGPAPSLPASSPATPTASPRAPDRGWRPEGQPGQPRAAGTPWERRGLCGRSCLSRVSFAGFQSSGRPGLQRAVPGSSDTAPAGGGRDMERCALERTRCAAGGTACGRRLPLCPCAEHGLPPAASTARWVCFSERSPDRRHLLGHGAGEKRSPID